jgi:transcriptional regulator GlxA family with amidase domain
LRKVRNPDTSCFGSNCTRFDLALALLEEDHGRDFALSVARFLVLFLKRSGGQAQFSTHLQAQFSEIPAIQRVQAWCLANLDGELSVAEMAREAGMSERNFARVFRDETGRSPGEFIASARLQAACRLIEESELTLKAIALRCGIGTAPALRRMFMSRLGVTPLGYRDKFRTRVTAVAA